MLAWKLSAILLIVIRMIHNTAPPLEEKEYRELVTNEFKKIEKAFDDVDPDEAEFDLAQGAVTIAFSDGARLILSQQPSVRQIWVAAATKGVAHHFDYDATKGTWMDDKGQGLELLAFVRGMVQEATGISLTF